LTSKATITLTVNPPPSFSLAATPASLSVTPGSSGASSVAITDISGFTGTVTLAASGLPAGVTATFTAVSGGKSTVTFAASSSAASSTSTITITGKSGSLTETTTIALTVASGPTFTLTASPTSLSIAQGATGTSILTLTPLNGFTGTVTVTVSALPSGVQGSFSNGPTPVSVALTLAITASAALGPSTITLTGKSGSITQTATVSLTVLGPGAGNALVNLAPLYNVAGIVTDFTSFTGGGLDAGGRAYSSSQLGAVQTVSGAAFSLGPANAPDAVSNATIPLPAGQYSTLTLLATGVNGAQPNQTFTVKYSDGTTTSFTQSLSDWCTPQNYPGETVAVPMTYRDLSNATRDTRALALYSYSFNLASGKTVSSITLPSNRNVVVLAASLSTASSSSR